MAHFCSTLQSNRNSVPTWRKLKTARSIARAAKNHGLEKIVVASTYVRVMAKPSATFHALVIRAARRGESRQRLTAALTTSLTWTQRAYTRMTLAMLDGSELPSNFVRGVVTLEDHVKSLIDPNRECNRNLEKRGSPSRQMTVVGQKSQQQTLSPVAIFVGRQGDANGTISTVGAIVAVFGMPARNKGNAGHGFADLEKRFDA